MDDEYDFPVASRGNRSKGGKTKSKGPPIGKSSGNHLLNFKYEMEKPQPYYGPRRKSYGPVFKKERFMQANYRFTVNQDGDYKENLSNPDRIVDWDNIEQVTLQTQTEANCPICLSPFIVPKAGKCGHVFCWACIIRHLSYSVDKSGGSCPICFEHIILRELRSATLETVSAHKEGSSVHMTLMKRSKNSIFAQPRSRWRARAETFPTEESLGPDSIFARILVTQDLSPLLEREKQELETAIKEAVSCQDDSLPFLISAQEGLQSRIESCAISGKFKPKSGPNKVVSGSPPDLTKINLEKPPNGAERRKSSESVEKLAEPEPHRGGAPRVDYNEEGQGDFYYYYQADDGQLVMLHPINFKALLNEFGNFDNLPDSIDAEILEIEEMSQNDGLRRKHKSIAHIPLSANFQFVELDLRKFVSREGFKPFMDTIMSRSNKRKSAKRREQEERDREEAQRIANRIDFQALDLNNEEDFPSVSTADWEPESSTPDEFPDISGNVPIVSGSPNRPAPVRSFASAVSPQQFGTSPSREGPSFSSALRQAKPFVIPKDAVVKNSKTKGKQYVILSTTQQRRMQ